MKKIFFTLALIILILVSAIFIWFYLYGRSYVDLSVSGNTLRASFKISKLDSKKAEAFSYETEIGDDWQKGITVTINEASAQNLAEYLPKRVYIDLSGKRLTFKTLSFNKLQKPTTSAGEEFLFESDQPEVDLYNATSSGVVRVSPKVAKDLWNLSDKLDRIKIQLDKESLTGEIIIK